MPRKISAGVKGATSIVTVDQLSFNDNTITVTDEDRNLVLDANGTGDLTTGDVVDITDNTVSTNTTSGAFTVSGGAGIDGSLYVGGTININGTGINGVSIGASTPGTGSFSSLTSEGLSTFEELSFVTNTLTGSTGTVTHDTNSGDTWYHTGITGNIVANFTNVPTTDNRLYRMKLLLIQGNTGYNVSGIQINGSGETVRWSGYTAPEAGSNKTELYTFTLVRSGGAWTVFGSLSSFSPTLDGSTQALAAPSAAFIKRANPSAANGVYWIDHGTGPYQNYCYMDAGGHMLVGKIASSTSASSPWLYNGANWSASAASNESNCTTTTSSDGVTRGYYDYTMQTGLRLALGSVTNALTIPRTGETAKDTFTGSAVNLNTTFSRSDLLNWFTSGTGTSYTVFDNQPFCNRIGINRSDSSNSAMRFGITMNNENECNSNDSALGFGAYTNNQPTGTKSIPAGGFRWNPDTQYPAIGYIFVQ